jgi:hypothetical protein
MAKPIVLRYKGQEASFDHKKIDRSKLYGRKKRIPLDPEGNPCRRAELTDDGSILLVSGMTAQGYFGEDDRWIPSKELIGITEDGTSLEVVKSTLGVAQELEPATPEDLLDLEVLSVYQLDPVELPGDLKTELDEGHLFRFPFNYRDDFHAETGILVANQAGLFAVIGNPVPPEWLELETLAPVEDADDSDDLDFEMF